MLQTTMCLLSDSKVALAAGVGEDLPFSCREWLESMGILTECLIVKDLPTLRAWQIFEEDGRRTQVQSFNFKEMIAVPLLYLIW